MAHAKIKGLYMKKLFVPGLLLLSLTGLVACSEDSGLVKGGKAFKAGDSVAVSSDVKTNVEGKVKTVTQKTSTSTVTKTSYQGKTTTEKNSSSTTIKYNFVEKTIAGKTKSNGVSASFKAQQQADGSFQYVSGGDVFADTMDVDTLAVLYTAVQIRIYSWNYQSDSSDLLGSIAPMVGINEETLGAYAEITKEYESKLFISGDTEKGTFDIGLAEAYKFNLDLSALIGGGDDGDISSSLASALVGNIPLTITKMKESYKDGLLRSTITGAKFDMDLLGAKVAYDYATTTSFSYEMK